MGSALTPTRETLKDQAKELSILEVAKALGIEVWKQGNQYRARCLDKGAADNDPSLKFRLAKNTWKCFSCGRQESDVIELVKVKLGCDFSDALKWFKETFDLVGGIDGGGSGPIAQWARVRGLEVRSVRAFGVTHAGRGILKFPMRLEPGGAVVGYQKRRANDKPIASDKRSICEKGSKRALFVPLEWPTPDEKSVLLIVEGESDAVAAHSAGFQWVVGTPGTEWNREVWEALKVLRIGFPGKAVLIMDGNVADQELLERAHLLKARPVRVPLYVSSSRWQRDLNEWLKQEGAGAIRSAILNTRSYTVIFDDAEDIVLEAVRRTCGLKAEHRAPLRAIVSHVLRRVLPHAQRPFKGIKVGPGQWVFTRGSLMEVTGEGESTVRTLVKKLKLAGFWVLKPLGGSRGTLATVVNLSAYIKLTGRDYERSVKEATTYDSAVRPANRQKRATDRQNDGGQMAAEPCSRQLSGKTAPAPTEKTNRYI